MAVFWMGGYLSDLPNNMKPEDAYKIIEQFIHERNAKIQADMQWLNSNLAGASSATGSPTDKLNAKIVRRDQVLFCVGYLDKDEFNYSDIEAFVRQRFPNSNRGTSINVTSALSEMSKQDTGILTHTPRKDGYMFKYSIFRTCLRAMLRCPENIEIVEKIDLGRNPL